MSQIEVIAFGGAAALRKTSQTPFARAVNYYSVNDPLLLLVPSAAQALRSGFVSHTGDDEEEEFCFLAPRVGDPIGDHDLTGPTYATAMRWEGKRYKQRYQTLIYRTMRPACLFLLALFRALHQRVMILLKTILRPILRAILWSWASLEPATSRMSVFFVTRVWKPIVVFLVFLRAWIQDTVRQLRGEDLYVPAQLAIPTDASLDTATK